MSAPPENNNQNQVPTPDDSSENTPVQAYTRDSKYYYEDGNIVFLVGDVLFKLHRSILLSHMAEEPTNFAQITRSDVEQHGKGMNDHDPFVICEASAQQFRWFLRLLLGTPDDPKYLTLLMGAKNPLNLTKDGFACYLGIAILTGYFGMEKLNSWTHSQLVLVLESSSRFFNNDWDKYTIIQAIRYTWGCAMTLGNALRHFVQLTLSLTAPNNPFKFQPAPSSNLDTCVALYKDPEVLTGNPTLFGYIFTVILSLGHRSSIWTTQLTRDDRTVLYAAQVNLVSLHQGNGFRELSWLSRSLPPTTGHVCVTCVEHLYTAWNVSFARYGGLGSVVPLEDISKLVLLPSYLQIFADFIRSNPKLCECTCGLNILPEVACYVDNVFYKMNSQYKHFVE